ncbi:probable methyltransferase PMT24 [Lolium rigidum]|uniref:probable methyltransferase PMT24 n=1 Tax=Lolium rigidum TaxID=89674 RepID=UPI001F5CD5F0|nr:probable methyltransferase PMT24 [Lolium rigidum]
MAPGVGRSSRAAGKRGAGAASSSAAASACVYYATTGVLVALCVAGACFLTSTSSASIAGADGGGDTAGGGGGVTAYRHTTRSSFAYEVTREKAAPSPPREVEEGGAVEQERGTVAAVEDPHAAPDLDERLSGGEDLPKTDAAAVLDEEPGRVASSEAIVEEENAAAAGSAGTEQETAENDPEEQQPSHLQIPRATVEEKSLDGGIEEESNARQRQSDEEDRMSAAAGDEQPGTGILRREAQEGEATEQHLTEEERSSDQSQVEEDGRTLAESDAGQEESGGGGDDVSENKDDDADGTGAGSENQNGGIVDSLPGEEERGEDTSVRAGAWATQADQSHREKDRRKDDGGGITDVEEERPHEWRTCNVKAGADYIPCLDNEKAVKKLRPENFRRYEHRERHCPDEGPTCLVALPRGYRRPVEWPTSRDRIWLSNVPHTKLVQVKGHQNWVKVSGQYLLFPGGGTQFIHGALHYIDFLQQSMRSGGIAWGKRTRVVLDVGCGVASFGGYLFERGVVTMSFAPKDEHEAQVQMALERGIPAISAVMGSKRLPFPSLAFDLVHCARCRVPWHADGGALLLELNRVLRPGGLFVWSATPVYQKLPEDTEIWKAMSALTKSMCWELVTIKKDRLNGVGAAFYRKPTSNECYESRRRQQPPMCSEDDDANAAWYVRLNACLHRVPIGAAERGASWPADWPRRVRVPPNWLNSSLTGVYGKPAPEDFAADYQHWRRVMDRSYLNGLGVDWSRVRNVMDMRASYGGLAAALRDQKLWVMNVVNVDAPDTLPIIFDRGLFGMYHDWCESFSTYPRTYDLLHADYLFSKIKDRCAVLPVIVEVDRIVRPGGSIIVRDESSAVSEVEKLLKSLHWDVRLTFSKNNEGVMYAEKSDWRPELIAEPT